MSIKVEIKNLDRIKSAFDKSPRLMYQNLQKALQRTTYIISAQSRRNTPVDTGRLRASTYERFSSGLKAEVGTNANYDYFVHEGTRFMQARPYLRLAIEEKDGVIQQEFTNAVDDTLKQISIGIG